jgi:hypothetical protein
LAETEQSKKEIAGRIKDARGRVVSELDPVVMHLTHSPGVIPADTLRDIAQDIGFGINKGVRIALIAWIACSVTFVIALAILLSRMSAGTITGRRFAISLVPYGGIFTTFFAFWQGARNARHERIRKVMLKQLRCPHCGYDIRGLPTDPEDGATVCPECGCAWKLDRSDADGDNGNG